MANFSRFGQILTVGVSAACGSLVTYYGFNSGVLIDSKEQQYYDIIQNKESKWDSNWDR